MIAKLIILMIAKLIILPAKKKFIFCHLMIAKLIILPAKKKLIFCHLHLFYNSMANSAIKIYPEIYHMSIIS